MIYWSQLLHMYQPPTQTHEVLVRVANESYRPVLRVLLANPGARISININAVLTRMLAEHGQDDVLAMLRELGERGQVEFTGSGAYHPILPLVPHSVRVESIVCNERTNSQLLGEVFSPAGFFPPEMCISDDTLRDIRDAGYEWVIAGGVASPNGWPTSEVARVAFSDDSADESLTVLFRDDVRSNQISFGQTTPGQFLESLAYSGGPGSYVVTAMDIETFGHHIKGWEDQFLASIYRLIESERAAGAERVRVVTLSELVGLMPKGPLVRPRPSSWSTSNDDLDRGDPYPLWRSPGNRIHAWQWEHVGHVISLVDLAVHSACTEEAIAEANFARERLQPALHSCQFWWASSRPWWSVLMIHRGLMLLQETLLHAARVVERSCASDEAKEMARWRVAAANRVRDQLEERLFLDAAP